MTTDATELAATLSNWQSAFEANPEEWHQPGICRYCNAALPQPHMIESTTGAFTMAVTSCEPCITTRRAQYEADLIAQKRASLTRFCPPDFAEEWNDKIGNNALRAEAFKHFSISTGRGLLIHAVSGHCKTRIAWEIVKGLEVNPPYEGFTWKFLDSYELAASGIPKAAHDVPLLVIDDLGNEPASTKWETGLLFMLKKRCDYHRPTIITTQLNAQQLTARFFTGSAGMAILRRLMQRCTAITG